MPPFSKITGKAVFCHYVFQKPGIVCRGFGAVGVIPVSQSRKIVKACGHLQFFSVTVHQGNIDGATPAMRTAAGFGRRNIGWIGTGLPQRPLPGNGAKRIPKLYGHTHQAKLILHLCQLFHRTVAQIGIPEFINLLSGKVVLRSIFQLHHNVRDILLDRNKVTAPGFRKYNFGWLGGLNRKRFRYGFRNGRLRLG